MGKQAFIDQHSDQPQNGDDDSDEDLKKDGDENAVHGDENAVHDHIVSLLRYTLLPMPAPQENQSKIINLLTPSSKLLQKCSTVPQTKPAYTARAMLGFYH